MPMPAHNQPSPSESPVTPPAPRAGEPLRTWKRDLWLAVAIFLYFEIASWLAIHHRPAGEAFILTPHAWAAFFDFLASVVVMTLFYILYTIPAFIVRPSLGCMLRLLMFLLFVAFLTFQQGSNAIAVVRTESEFVFIRPFPFASQTVRRTGVPPVSLNDTGVVRALTLRGLQQGDIACKPVWHGDTRTNQILDELVASLRTRL